MLHLRSIPAAARLHVGAFAFIVRLSPGVVVELWRDLRKH